MKGILFILGLLMISSHLFCQSDPNYESFDALDSLKWNIQSLTFNGNGCNFTPENVQIYNSALELTITTNHNPQLPKFYNAGEIFDKRFFRFGYFTVRMKSSIREGSVSSFFLMSPLNRQGEGNQELDIEFLGRDLHAVQFSAHDISLTDNQRKSENKTVAVDFNIAKAFHVYGILWNPDSVSWFIDNRLVYTSKTIVPQIPMQIRMNHWCADEIHPTSIPWLGHFPESKNKPSIVYYDWIKVFTLKEYYQSTKVK